MTNLLNGLLLTRSTTLGEIFDRLTLADLASATVPGPVIVDPPFRGPLAPVEPDLGHSHGFDVPQAGPGFTAPAEAKEVELDDYPGAQRAPEGQTPNVVNP